MHRASRNHVKNYNVIEQLPKFRQGPQTDVGKRMSDQCDRCAERRVSLTLSGARHIRVARLTANERDVRSCTSTRRSQGIR